MSFTISIGRPTRGLFCIALALCLISLAGQFSKYILGHGRVFGLVSLFDVDRENSIPNWFSSVLLLTCCALFFVNSRSGEGQRQRRRWLGLALIFLILSADEVATIHESVIVLPLFEVLSGSSWRYFTWVVPGALIVAVFVMVYWRFWRELPRTIRRRFLMAGSLFVGGALGLELVAGLFLMQDEEGIRSFSYASLTTIEEFLEMAGSIVLIDALLRNLSRQRAASVHFVLRDKKHLSD